MQIHATFASVSDMRTFNCKRALNRSYFGLIDSTLYQALHLLIQARTSGPLPLRGVPLLLSRSFPLSALPRHLPSHGPARTSRQVQTPGATGTTSAGTSPAETQVRPARALDPHPIVITVTTVQRPLYPILAIASCTKTLLLLITTHTLRYVLCVSYPAYPFKARANRTVVVGAGPTGLFMALKLAEKGFAVDVYDARGSPLSDKTNVISAYDGKQHEASWVVLTARGVEALKKAGLEVPASDPGAGLVSSFRCSRLQPC